MAVVLFSIIMLAPGFATAQARADLFDRADTDKSGMVNEQEWHAATQKWFEEIDKNRDGQISREEWQQMKDSMRTGLRSRLRNR